MPKLVFRKPNNISGSILVELRYRLAGTNLPYTELSITEAQFPHTVEGVQDGSYELGMRVKCANGSYSDWATGASDGCAPSTGFSVVRNLLNFDVLFKLGGTQNRLQVEVTNPNGGKAIHDYFGANAGTFSIPITQLIPGEWAFRLRGVCNHTVTPAYASAWSAPVYVDLVENCNPPVLTSIDTIASDTNTFTKRVVYSGYTTQVRARVMDLGSGVQYYNVTAPANGIFEIVLMKGRNYTISIFNQCAGGGESSFTTDANNESV